jgi:hypothetical protein
LPVVAPILPEEGRFRLEEELRKKEREKKEREVEIEIETEGDLMNSNE